MPGTNLRIKLRRRRHGEGPNTEQGRSLYELARHKETDRWSDYAACHGTAQPKGPPAGTDTIQGKHA